MKNIILSVIAATVVLAACNNSSSAKKETNKDTVQTTATNVDTSTKPAIASAAANQPASIKEIVAGYLQMKNAFAKDDSKEASAAGNEMVKTFANFNKSALTAEQTKIYNDIEDDAREHAEHIGSNAGKIEHQREHFDMLSKDVYQLVKTFGGGQKLYYDHCPMYNDGKGANWISETREIKNPYYGKSMSTCGSVKEELK